MDDDRGPAAPFDRVVFIYNPAKAGMAVRIDELQRDLAADLPGLPIELLPTGFAGHARDLARSVAGSGRPLIVSVSGDGGYNEVVNGGDGRSRQQGGMHCASRR